MLVKSKSFKLWICIFQSLIECTWYVVFRYGHTLLLLKLQKMCNPNMHWSKNSVFIGIPDLSRCWPRIPSLATRSSSPVAPLFSPLDGQPTKGTCVLLHLPRITLAAKLTFLPQLEVNNYCKYSHGLSIMLALIPIGCAGLLTENSWNFIAKYEWPS